MHATALHHHICSSLENSETRMTGEKYITAQQQETLNWNLSLSIWGIASTQMISCVSLIFFFF
jgi:hypothetical protein